MIDIYNRLGSDQTYIPQVETEDGMEQILSQIKMILGTAPCDVLGAPYFGANIKKYLFNLSYNQQEITNFVTNIILTNIDYDRQKYSVDDEFALERQKGRKPIEYEQYDTYCENAKAYAKELLDIKENS